MAVRYLGQVGERRESVLTGGAKATTALRESIQAGQEKERGRTFEAGESEKTRGFKTREAEKERAHELVMEKAKIEFDMAEEDRKYVRTALQNAANMQSQDASKWELFKQTDGYTELQKLAKRVAPEFVVDGELVLPPATKMPDFMKDPEQAKRFKVETEKAMLDMKEGRALTPEKAANLLKAVEVAEYLDPSTMGANQELVKYLMGIVRGAGGPMGEPKGGNDLSEFLKGF